MSVLELARSAAWAMLPANVEEVFTIAARENDWTPESLSAYREKHLERSERAKERNGVAILHASGPMFKRANLFVEFSGATSYEILRRDLQAALDNPGITAIMLNIDSPGGEVSGCDELAKAIYEARSKKPITAFVSGMACSGGFWLASATDRIVVSDSAIVGSIGVVMSMTDRSKQEERNGVQRVEFVSSQSPGKRPDHKTDEGKAQIQRTVDDLAEVFVAAVAKYRGVTPDTVIKKFGAGGVEVGAKAVALGMADEVGQYEATLNALSKPGVTRRPSNPHKGVFPMGDTTTGASAENQTVDLAAATAHAAAEAETNAQTRIKAILASEEGKALPTLANHLAFDTKISADAAIATLKAAKSDVATAPAASTTVEPPRQDSQASFEDRKAQAGALGLAAPDAREGATAAHAAGWDKAVANANRRFE